MSRGAYIIGVDIATLSFDPNELNAITTQLISQGSEADAIVVATDLNGTMDDMVTRLQSLGGQDALVAAGTTIENQAYDLVTKYDAQVGDPALPGKVAALQASAFAWQPQALAALRNAPATAGVPTVSSITDSTTGAAQGAPGDAVTLTGTNFGGVTAVDFNGVPAQFQVVSATQIAATVPQGATSGPVHVTNPSGTGVSAFTVASAASPPYSGPSDGGGSSGGGGGGADSGDPGNIDWGDGEPGAPNGGDDPLETGGGGGDQGFDWGEDNGDAGVTDQRSHDDTAPSDDADHADPFESLLPDDQGAGGDDQTDEGGDGAQTEDLVGSYLNGIDESIGARTKQTVMGDVAHPPFSNREIYHRGDVVTYWGQYWQATRDVLPPLVPLFMSGEVPGSSDAWSSMSAEDVVNKIIGADTIPSAGATYTDKKTVGAVQSALNDHGFGPLVVDGVMGPKTVKAIRAAQTGASIPPTGVIDEGVIAMLQVTPGVLPPGVTLQQKTAVEAQAALDAATAVEHAATPQDLQSAAQQVVDAAPAAPPELKQQAAQAHSAVLLATTPAELAQAKQQVQAIAHKVQAAVVPGWWSSPVWQGAPVNRLQGIVGTAGVAAIVAGVVAAVRRK